jgi:hypothetical protein
MNTGWTQRKTKNLILRFLLSRWLRVRISPRSQEILRKEHFLFIICHSEGALFATEESRIFPEKDSSLRSHRPEAVSLRENDILKNKNILSISLA